MERKEGRSFDDSDDEEFQQERNHMKILLEKFDSVEYVLENAALTSALFNYMFNKSEEYFTLLYVYVIRKYIRLNETKNSTRNYNHINMEIYTTFIHPKSILKIEYSDEEINQKIEDTIDSEDCIIYFNKISQTVVSDVINKCLQQFRETIRLGLESYSYMNKIYEEMNRTKELKILESLHNNISSSIIRNQRPRLLSHPITDSKEVDLLNEFQSRAISLAMNTQYEYFVKSKKYSYTIKNPECMIRSKTFLSPSIMKPIAKQRIRGHNFEEYSMPKVTFCVVCELIIWGPHPCCIYCHNCKHSIHRNCKDSIKYCRTDIKLKKSETFDSNVKETSGNKGVKHAKSFDLRARETAIVSDEITRSESTRSRSRDPHFRKSLHKRTSRSASENGRLSNCVEPLPVLFSDLDKEMNVLETFEAEIELKQFPAITEHASFCGKDDYQRLLVFMEFHHKSKFIRMTLKRIKYMFIDPWRKMDEFLELFDTLSLSCVEKLYTLIGSLVDLIDSCKFDESYDLRMAQRILNWLTEDGEYNLMCWFQLSTDLCCTNLLNSVKANWNECKQISPKLNVLFSVEINRILVIEQLSNMRPLLLNLPMIVTKIVKDLNRFPKFKDEAKIWELVRHKLSHLPRLIDERCIPVVDLINEGVIVASSVRYKQYTNGYQYNGEMETFINNFPKTIFKNEFVDFQLVKISNLREYRQGDAKSKLSCTYIRDEIDAAVIIYDKEIIILQKENDKYLLKLFKSSGDEKLFPMIPLQRIHAGKNTAKDNLDFPHELTVLLLDEAILVQILFKTDSTRDMWFDHIIKKSSNAHRNIKLVSNRVTTPLRPITAYNDDIDGEKNSEQCPESNIIPKSVRMESVKSTFRDTISHIQTLFDMVSGEVRGNVGGDGDLKQSGPSTSPESSGEFMMQYVQLLKDCATLGHWMMEQSQTIDPNVLLRGDVIRNSKSNLQTMAEQMNILIRSTEKNIEEKRPSQESSSDDNVIDTSFNIESLWGVKLKNLEAS